MLQDLDSTLRELLTRELPDDLVPQINFNFETPNKESITQLPAINLFLYDMRENLELRSAESIIERRADGTATTTRPPARVDCSYLITAWPRESAGDSNEQRSTPTWYEHMLLGEVMKVLMRHRTLPPEVLQGRLAGQTPPLRGVPLRQGYLQSLGEFWQAMGGKPKATLNYTITVSVPLYEPKVVPLVTDSQIYLKPSSQPTPRTVSTASG